MLRDGFAATDDLLDEIKKAYEGNSSNYQNSSDEDDKGHVDKDGDQQKKLNDRALPYLRILADSYEEQFRRFERSWALPNCKKHLRRVN